MSPNGSTIAAKVRHHQSTASKHSSIRSGGERMGRPWPSGSGALAVASAERARAGPHRLLRRRTDGTGWKVRHRLLNRDLIEVMWLVMLVALSAYRSMSRRRVPWSLLILSQKVQPQALSSIGPSIDSQPISPSGVT